MTRLAVTSILATAILLPLPVAGSDRQATLEQFERAVNAYVDLHRRIERSLPQLRPSDDWEEISRAVEARAAAIRDARPAAAPGDLFVRPVAELIRDRIRAVLKERGVGAGDLADGDEETRGQAARPVVNGRFPWARGAMMPPDILQALPPLPEELQYRIVDRDLVLIDMHADLVVDILFDALPASAPHSWR